MNHGLKIKRLKGEEYCVRRKTEEGKIVFDVHKSKRTIKRRCSCNNNNRHHFKCFNITEEKRNTIFETFWNLTWGERKVSINSLVDEKPVAQRINGEGMESRRNHTLTYHLKPDLCKERGKVCKTMFLHTLGLREWTVLNWILTEHTEETVELDNDQRVDDDNVNNEEVDKNKTLMPKGKKDQKLLLQ